MDPKESIPLKKLMADANRILYIDLVGPLKGNKREKVRQEIFKVVKGGLKWYSENKQLAYTFYKNDDREYAKLAAEIQSYPRHIQFYCDGADYTSPKEHVRFQIFEPMPMDVVAVDQAAENDIPMELMAGMENLTLNGEEYNLPLLRANRLLYINVADSEEYSDKELSVIRAALRRILMNISWKEDQKSKPYLFYKVNDSQTLAQLADQVHAAINSMPDTLREKFKVEFTIFVPMRRDVVAEEPAVGNEGNERPAVENNGNERPAVENEGNEEPADQNDGDDGPPVEEEGKEEPTYRDVKPEGPIVKDVKKEELTDSDTETKEPTTSELVIMIAINRKMLADIETSSPDQVEILAVAEKCEEIQEVVTKDGRRVTKRDVHLVDESGTMMKLTLWRDQALKINPQMISGKVVHGKRLIVKKTENGFISLTMNNHSYFASISDMENEQVHKLWSWYTNERSSVTIVEQSFQPIAVPKPLHDVQTVEGLFVSKATILSIDLDNTFYKGCPECQKKVTEVKNRKKEQFKCSGCGKTLEQFSWIVMLQVILGDGDTSLHAVVFSSVGERLIEMDGNALVNMKQSDIFEHNKLIERLVGMEREWFIRTKKSSLNNKLKHVITGW